MKFFLLLVTLLSSCHRSYSIPIEDLINTLQTSSFDRKGNYKLTKYDTVTLIVHENSGLNAVMTINGSGKINHPLFSIHADGLTLEILRKKISSQLKKYTRNPIFRLELNEPRNLKGYISGEIKKPGRYQLIDRMRIVDLIALAGGPTDYFDGHIVLIRRGQKASKRYLIKYDDLIEGRFKLDQLHLERDDHIFLQ